MIAFKPSSRRRVALLTSGSLAALCLTVAAAAPSQAQAQTCPGDYCDGTYTEITYTNVGFLFLTAGHDLNVTTGGLYVSGQPGSYTALYSDADVNGIGIRINNTTGAGLEFDNPSGTIDIGLYRDGMSNGPMAITGTTAGVRLNGGGWFWTTPQVDFSIYAGTITATNGAGILASFNSELDMQLSATVTGTTAAISTSGTGFLRLQNADVGRFNGALLLNNTGGVSFTNKGDWRASGANVFGAAGFASLTNRGTIAVSGTTEGADTMTITGLNFWENSGSVLLGATEGLATSDGVANDRLVLANAITFNGLLGSRFVMDVAFSGAGQANCLAAVDADCVDLRGSTVMGSTEIVVNSSGGPGSLKPIVLVDVGGGTSAASRFTLSPDSSGYTSQGGGLLQQGLFDYELAYDETARQHLLMPHPNATLRSVVNTGAMADSVWEATTGHWRSRQADLRDAGVDTDGPRAGVWIKAVNNSVQRTSELGQVIGGEAIVYDTSYDQDTQGFVGGIDLASVQDDSYGWVVGVTAGRVTSDVDFKLNSATPQFEGVSYGVYGTLLAGPLFIDAIVNANSLDLDYDLGFGQSAASEMKTLGAQAEAGYRFSVNDGAAFLEPIATLQYIKRDLGSMELSEDLAADLGEETAMKGAVGLRVGGRMDVGGATVGLALTGRAWEQFQGEQQVLLTSPDEELAITSEKLGTVGDVGLSLNVLSPNRRLTGFADYGFKFADGYSDSTASLGVRFSF